MGLFKKILNAGEGRKLKLLESIVPEVAALEPEMERALRRRARARLTAEFRQPLRATARTSTTCSPEAFADGARGRAGGCSASATSTSR